MSESDLLAAAQECDPCLGSLERGKSECYRAFTFYLTLRSDVSCGKEARNTP